MHALLDTLCTKTEYRGCTFYDSWVLNTGPLFDGPSELLFRFGIPACERPLFVHFGGGAYLALLANSGSAAAKTPCRAALINAEDLYFIDKNSSLTGIEARAQVYNPGEIFPEEWRNSDCVFIRTWKQMDLNMAWVRALAQELDPAAAVHLIGGNDDGIRNIKTRLSKLAPVREEHIGCHSRWLSIRAGDFAGKIDPAPEYAGIFGGGAHDRGTALLLEFAGDLRDKSVCDLGSGSGVIAEFAAVSGAHRVLAADNQYLAIAHSKRALAHYPQIEHRAGFIGDDIDERFEVLLTNPPFHLEGRTRLLLGALWLKGAKRLLARRGEIRLVANEFLDYRTFAADCGLSCETIAHDKGFRIYLMK